MGVLGVGGRGDGGEGGIHLQESVFLLWVTIELLPMMAKYLSEEGISIKELKDRVINLFQDLSI